ncbi:MAG: hypothetical protein WBC60_19915 [Cognaticolwellia sp.]|jgi:hypothetical protein
MQKFIIALSMLFFSLSTLAIDIDKACKERDEQKHALLSNMSTSISEALLAGQCIGYKKASYNNFNISTFADLSKACSEFVEQKEALLPFNMSTNLTEAMYAGMCLGAIYKIATKCNSDESLINYLYIAKGIIDTTESQAVFHIDNYLNCSE